ncbi:uncharacterized protein LOC112046354 isoform X2 [Bicyclus anynana]|nr:uncharacterized protein LOC112046354 isoform X2 [Bicyclus anynana]
MQIMVEEAPITLDVVVILVSLGEISAMQLVEEPQIQNMSVDAPIILDDVEVLNSMGVFPASAESQDVNKRDPRFQNTNNIYASTNAGEYIQFNEQPTGTVGCQYVWLKTFLKHVLRHLDQNPVQTVDELIAQLMIEDAPITLDEVVKVLESMGEIPAVQTIEQPQIQNMAEDAPITLDLKLMGKIPASAESQDVNKRDPSFQNTNNIYASTNAGEYIQSNEQHTGTVDCQYVWLKTFLIHVLRHLEKPVQAVDELIAQLMIEDAPITLDEVVEVLESMGEIPASAELQDVYNDDASGYANTYNIDGSVNPDEYLKYLCLQPKPTPTDQNRIDQNSSSAGNFLLEDITALIYKELLVMYLKADENNFKNNDMASLEPKEESTEQNMNEVQSTADDSALGMSDEFEDSINENSDSESNLAYDFSLKFNYN